MNVERPVRAIARRSLHAELIDRLQEMIIDGTLPPGSKVPERDLCEQFGVSRTPMREALKVLAADGYLSLEPNRGAWVSAVTLEELEEVFPVMGALEALAGELACERLTSTQFDQISRLHRTMIRCFETRRMADYFSANQEIHERILEAADNATLTAQYRALASRVRRARYLANMSEDRWAQAVEEHEEILKALHDRDGARLAGILKRHLHNKFETVRDWLAANEDVQSPDLQSDRS